MKFFFQNLNRFLCFVKIPDYNNAVIVARHPGAVKRATAYAERLKLGIAVIHGEEKLPESEQVFFYLSNPFGIQQLEIQIMEIE